MVEVMNTDRYPEQRRSLHFSSKLQHYSSQKHPDIKKKKTFSKLGLLGDSSRCSSQHKAVWYANE